MTRRASSVALAILAAGLVTAHADAVTLTKVGRFVSPVYVTAPAGDTDRVFVVERRGTIRIIDRGRVRPRPFLDIRSSVPLTNASDDERGLLSMAFAPDYATTGRYYVYRIARRRGAPLAGKIVVEEYQTSGAAATRTDPATRRLVLAIRADKNHFGGQLAFGPDGYLWLAPGDGKRRGDPGRNGQNPRTLLGKIVRIDPRPGARLAPADNPFRGAEGSPFVWAYGLRNPFRFSFDRATGDLIIGDVGQNFAEEIDFAPSAGGLGRGANYGWNILEGRFRYRISRPTRLRPARPGEIPAGAVLPAIEHLHRNGWCSIIGGYVVRDPELPGLAGRYVYGDFCRSRINSAVLTGAGAQDVRPTGLRVPGLVSFGEDGCGRVYAVSIAGPVYRLSESGRCAGPAPTPFPIAAPGDQRRDTTRPSPTVTARPRQRPRGRTFTIRVGCDEACVARSSARVLITVGGSRRITFATPTTRRIPGGQTATLRLRVPVRTLRDLRAAGRARVFVDVVVSDDAGNRRAGHVRLTLFK